jgi:hypothetical protein
MLDPNKLQKLPSTCTETASEIENPVEKPQTIESISMNTHVEKQLEKKLTTLFSKKLSSALETINQTLQGFEKHLSTIGSSQVPAKTDKKTATKTLNTPQQIEPIPSQNKACQNDIQVHKNNDENNHQDIQDVVVSSDNYGVKIAAFNYPEALDTEQCQALQGLLIKSGNRAQDLLTLLAQRLQNTHNPVVDPTSYFASLVYKYQYNTLDFSGLSTIKTPKSAQEKAHQKQFDELKLEHHTCHSDFCHFEKLVETEMKKSQKSFQYVCENHPLGGIIENCAQKLQQAKTALDNFLVSDHLIPA